MPGWNTASGKNGTKTVNAKSLMRASCGHKEARFFEKEMQMRRNKYFYGAAVIGAILLVGASQTALAHGGATGVVKERMDLMSSIGDRMKVIAAMVKGEKSFDAETVADKAGEIAEHGPKVAPTFHEKNLDEPSEALPAIWTDWDKFEGLTQDLTREAEKLAATAKDGDKRAVMVQFVKLGKVCSACHTDYRKKKDH